MPSPEPNGQDVRQQLERILGSPGFSRNERLSGFLRYVVEGHLDGRDDELKESVIAVEVFGRSPDFDSRLDPVVRTEAIRLRARLSDYYLNVGNADSLIIELPKGGYIPRFRVIATEQPVTAPTAEPIRALGRRRLWLKFGLAGLTIAIVAGVSWWVQRPRAPIAIAVLPLENSSRDPASDYFADGLTDELIRNLSIIEGLTVRSRTSSFALKGKAANIRDVGEQLHADYILEGSVLREGEHMRIDAQLVRVRDDHILWSRPFDKALTDVFAIQDEISLEVVNNLRLTLGHGRRRYETSVEAYDLYLHARAMPDQRTRAKALEAAGIYQQVIAKDQLFAPAYAGLAGAYAAISAQGFDDHTEELTEMRDAAEKAIEIDPLLAEAHDALGMVYARDGQWAQSEKSFRQAIELEPNNTGTYNDYSTWLLLPLGRIQEAVHQMRVAGNVDPLSPFIRVRLGTTLIFAGKYDEAASCCADSPQCLARARLFQGRVNEAIQLLSTIPKSDLNTGYLGYAYGKAGRREDAEKLAAALSSNAYSQALIYAGLGDKDRTFEALNRMADLLGAVRIGRALNTPELELLRSDLRVNALRQKVGLPQ
jgi:TolB-like protein